jgi:hypothetical protein
MQAVRSPGMQFICVSTISGVSVCSLHKFLHVSKPPEATRSPPEFQQKPNRGPERSQNAQEPSQRFPRAAETLPRDPQRLNRGPTKTHRRPAETQKRPTVVHKLLKVYSLCRVLQCFCVFSDCMFLLCRETQSVSLDVFSRVF